MTGSVRHGIRRRVAALLERPQRRAEPHFAWLAAPWVTLAEPSRPLVLPPDLHCIGIAGTTLGGSGATPVALELCRALAARGLPVVYVAHGYSSRRLRLPPRQVLPETEPCDEARLAARKLAPLGVSVFVAERRQAALDRAIRALPRGGVVILDGALQSVPRRLSEAVLVLDAEYPWGSGMCPPLGDLTAPRARLLTADTLLALDRGGPVHSELPRRARRVSRNLLGVYNALSGECRELAWLAAQPFQLALAIARPDRVREQLARHGARARRVVEAADHAGLAALLTPKKSSLAEFWVCTAKCWEATSARDSRLAERVGDRVWILEERLELPRSWVESLVMRFAEPSGTLRASDRFDDSQRTGQGC